MIGIIQDWLFIQSGINFDFKTLTDNNIFKDGLVFEVILKQYGLINHNICCQTPTNNNIQCRKNLYLLKPLFDMLKVNYSDSVILDIVEGKSSTIMKLLYELYICLENKQHLYFIKQVNYEKVRENLLETSNVKELNENVTGDIVLPENVCFENPLLQNKDIIKWYEKKYTYVQNNLSTKLNSLKKEICQETLIHVNKSINACSCTKASDEMPLPDLNMYSENNNLEKLLNYNEFITMFKNKLRQKIGKTHLEKSIKNEILNSTWNKIQENENKMYNDIFSEMLLKQSYYEKQILNKLVSSQKQINVEKDNQTTANKKLINEQEGFLINGLTLKEDFFKLEELYGNEQKRIFDLHKKLYKEKQALKKKLNFVMCNDIVRDLIDMSVIASEFKSKYGLDVPKNLWNNWMQLFVKDKPVHIPFENLEERVSYITELEYDNIIESEKEFDEVLNENDVEEYLMTCGRWFFKDICLEEGTNDDKVISFIIYRLLSSKYPPPETPLPANIPMFQSATILLDFEYSNSIDKLKMLLSKSKIHVFDTETAIKEALYTFQKETVSPTDTAKVKKKLNSKYKSDNRPFKNLIPKQSTKKAMKSKKGKKKGDHKTKKSATIEEQNYNYVDKETQTSEDVNENITIRTALGLIGEEVSKLLNEGKNVDDSLIIKVIIEYLKTLKDVNGWLLLNYPTTLYQAYELELALTGKKLPIEDYIVIGENEPNTKENYDGSNFMVMSKLYPPPEICNDNKKFTTYFSQVITTKYDDSQSPETNAPKIKKEIAKSEENLSNCSRDDLGEITLQEDSLKLFYLEQAIFHHYNCDITNLNHIKKLARIILKEDSINATNSIELFGKEIIKSLINVKAQSKKKKPSSAGLKSKKTSASKRKQKMDKSQTIDSFSSKPKTSSDGIDIIPGIETVTTMDMELPKKLTTQSKVFGKEIIKSLMNVKAQSKKKKPSSAGLKSKKTSASKRKQKMDKSQTIDSFDSKPKTSSDGIVIIPGIETVTTMDMELSKKLTTQSKVSYPGESGWEYITLPINNELSVLLANVWENIENCYLSSLRDIFFQNRIINLRLVPYSAYVREEIEKIVNKPDTKQDVVNHFTKYYREVDDNLRYLPDIKSQLHCKVFEMQQILWKISDNGKKELESKRQQIVLQNWVENELCLLVNNYLCLIQCESNRSFETMKLINNYYLSMLYELPPATSNIQHSQPLTKKFSGNVFLKTNKMSVMIPEIKQSVGSRGTSSNFGECRSPPSENIIVYNLINCCESEYIFSIINEFLLEAVSKATADIKNTVEIFDSQIKNEEHILSSNKKKEIKGKSLQSEKTKNQSVVNIKPRKKSKTKHPIETKTDIDDRIEKQKLLLLEWHYALISEEARLSTYLKLVNKKAQENIMEFYCYIESVFCQLYENNLSKYNDNILNINKLCEFLHTAIEEECPIIHSPILEKDNFFINKTGIFIPKDEQCEQLKELTEKIHPCYFTIKQLNKLVDVFRIAGPHGVIRKQPFCYILQDLMLFNSEDNQPHLPEIWHLLSESQLRDVIDNIFGTAYSIDWRDFIIYNLEIPYPSIADLLAIRKTFLLYDPTESETIQINDYEKVILWFEVDLPSNPTDGLKLWKIKKLLFEMFKVNENTTNYTALLVYFCKDYEPHNGLSKALSLSLGKYVITSKVELDQEIINEKETKDNVQTLLNDILNSIVKNRDGILIYEIFNSITKFDINCHDSHGNSSESILPDSIDSNDSSVKNKEFVLSTETEMNNIDEITFKYNVDLYEKSKISKIPVASVIGVLNSLFHNQDKTYDLRNLYLRCLEEEADFEGMIEGHALISLSCIQKLFNVTNKFKISIPCEILQQCLKL